MNDFFSSLEELLTGRAYLPIYAFLSQEQPVIAPVLFFNSWV